MTGMLCDFVLAVTAFTEATARAARSIDRLADALCVQQKRQAVRPKPTRSRKANANSRRGVGGRLKPLK